MPADAPHSEPRGQRLRTAAVGLLIAALAFVAYRPYLATGLLGFDTFPTILSARIQSVADLAGTFTEDLMDGRFRLGGVFYRPLTNLSFALDYALGGLDPAGYQLSDLAILIGAGLACLAVTRRVLGSSSLLAGAFAGLLFVLHPIQIEVVPVPPRRADILAIALVMATLALQPRAGGSSPSTRWRTAWIALLALGAMAAKETGVLVVPLVLVLHALEELCLPRTGTARDPRTGTVRVPRTESASSRSAAGLMAVLRRALWSGRATLAAFVGFAALRTWALAGLGGHPDSSIADVRHMFGLLEPYFDWLLLPEHFQAGALAVGSLLVVLAALGGLGWWVARGPRANQAGLFEREAEPALRAARARLGLLLIALFFLGLLFLHSMAGDRVEPWYAAVFCAPYAIGLGMLLDLGLRALRAGRSALAAPLCLVPLGLALSHLRVSALVHDYGAWRVATGASDAFLARFDETLRGARPGQPIVMDRLPLAMPPPTQGPGVRSAVMLNTYSLEAYAELSRPDLVVRVHSLEGGPPPAQLAADEIGIWVTPRALTAPGQSSGGGGR